MTINQGQCQSRDRQSHIIYSHSNDNHPTIYCVNHHRPFKSNSMCPVCQSIVIDNLLCKALLTKHKTNADENFFRKTKIFPIIKTKQKHNEVMAREMLRLTKHKTLFPKGKPSLTEIWKLMDIGEDITDWLLLTKRFDK